MCFSLEDFDNTNELRGMTDERFKETMIVCIKLVFRFLHERLEECPHFLHIIEIMISQINVTEVRNDSHKCCQRTFLDNDDGQIE